MDTALRAGSFASAANGRPYRISGADELFQRAVIRLIVPRGAFRYNASLGSRLHTLTGAEPDTDAVALLLAREALRSVPGTEAQSAAYENTAPPTVKITVSCRGESREIEVTL